MDKAHSSISLTKIDLNDLMVDFGFAVNYEMKLLKSNTKMTENQLVRFEKSAVVDFLVKMCIHLIEKSSLSSYFARCL